MTSFTRRGWIQGNLAILAGAGASAALPAVAASETTGGNAPERDKRSVKLAMALSPTDQRRWKLAVQIGVRHAIVNVSGALRRVPREQYADALAKVKADYEAAGLTIAGVESHPVGAERIKLGLPGRDEEIANYCAAITALGQVGIPMVCYNFMAGLGWHRTRVDIPERGGALTSGFDHEIANKRGLTRWGEISEEQIWDNLAYFLKQVIPVAEKAGVKMALHPDDPPISPLRGIGRILTSAAAYRKVLQIVPSPVNGITFCQANFKAMGEDLEAVAREFCGQGKVFFVHFRDIRGSAEKFQETFHDNGTTDMPRMLRVYHQSGFDGPMRPDHAPTLEGESNQNPGYAVLGKILAIGYMRGIMHALRIPVE